jgi:hypothetical protein
MKALAAFSVGRFRFDPRLTALDAEPPDSGSLLERPET